MINRFDRWNTAPRFDPDAVVPDSEFSVDTFDDLQKRFARAFADNKGSFYCVFSRKNKPNFYIDFDYVYTNLFPHWRVSVRHKHDKDTSVFEVKVTTPEEVAESFMNWLIQELL